VVIGVVVIHVVVLGTLPPHLFEFCSAFACLSAIFTVALHGVTHSIFRLVNTPFTSFVCPRRNG
jgi:hypothetical protein